MPHLSGVERERRSFRFVLGENLTEQADQSCRSSTDSGLSRSSCTSSSTQHVHGDVLVHVGGDPARTTANQLVYFYRNGEAPHRTSGLRTAYTAVRTPAGWRFSDMRLTLAWVDER